MILLPCRERILPGLWWIMIAAISPVFAAETAGFPAHPLRLIVPAPADGGASVQARLLAPSLRAHLGHQVLVEHRAGAGGVTGSAAVAQAPADGHTLLLTSAALAVNAAWLPEQMPFDALTAFAPVSLIATAPLVLAVHPGVPAKTVPELVALAKRARPVVRAGGNAAGSLSHVALTLFSRAAGFRAETVLFNGGGPAAQSLAQGQYDLLLMAAPVAVPLVSTQRLRALAVTAAEPMPQLSGVPAMKQFFPGLVIENWYALLAPAATPQPVIMRLQTEVRRALGDETVSERYAALGLVAAGSTPEGLAQTLQRDVARYAGLIRRGDLRLQ